MVGSGTPVLPPGGTGERQVFHVCDDPDLVSSVADALADTDDRFVVSTDADLAAAAERVAEAAFDAVVVDASQSPEASLEFVRDVRGDNPTLPVVLYATDRSNQLAKEALAAGATDVLEVDGDAASSQLLATRVERAVARSRAEAAAAWFRRQFDALYENPLVLGAVVGPDGAVERFNERAVSTTAVTPDADRGRSFWELPWWRTAADSAAVRTYVRRASAGETVQFRSDYAAVDGTRTMLAVLRPVERDGRVDRVLAIGYDVTGWAEHEAELERQNSRLDAFTSIVSHDLRSPLAVATGHLELARRDAESDHLDHVERALDRMDRLVTDLRTLARHGDDLGAVEPVDLATVAHASWETTDTETATLVVETDRSVVADPIRLEQLLENLFRNCVEHGSTSNRTVEPSDDSVEHRSTSSQAQPVDSVEHGSADGNDPEDATDDGSVTVTVGWLPDGTGFFVEDTGPGIPPDERDAVFEAGHSTSPDGTGLGLKIVDDIAQAHGWEITITDGRDGGARFEVRGVHTGTDSDADIDRTDPSTNPCER